jgi:hypothetical protein
MLQFIHQIDTNAKINASNFLAQELTDPFTNFRQSTVIRE